MGDRIQCVAVDLDFTLLNNNRDLCAEDAAALMALREKGIPFTFVTGRHFHWTRRFVRMTGLDVPFSSSNGGCIYDPKAGKVIKANTICPQLCAHIHEKGTAMGISISFHAVSGLYIHRENPRWAAFHQYNQMIDDPRDYYLPYELPEKGFSYEGIYKISAYNKEGQDVSQILGPIVEEAGLTMEYSERCLLDIAAPNSSKGDGIRVLAELMGFDLKHTIAFGDNENDTSMLNCVGHPVAVANALDETKAAAEYVTLTNEEHGVIHALRDHYGLL